MAAAAQWCSLVPSSGVCSGSYGQLQGRNLPSLSFNPYPSFRNAARLGRHVFQVRAAKNVPSTKQGNVAAGPDPSSPKVPPPDYDKDMPKLPGDEPDFWEGEKWDWLGFTLEYFWAFGIVFALVACGVAVRTYNNGATDFKQTPVYKEAMEAQGGYSDDFESSSPGFADSPAEAPALED